jgi:uncharacterized protein (DUF1800 family)
MALTEREKVAHLLRRFAFGASEAELDYYGKGGLSGAIDKLLNYENVEDMVSFDLASFGNANGNINQRVIQGIVAMRLIGTIRPLEEKMTLFWHNHFATSISKVDSPHVMMNHIGTLRTYATDKFGVLLEAISKDPGMIYWLDGQENVSGRPNENFAREVMELFTLGEGNYSEKDVQEAARCFTGWSYGVGSRARDNAPRRVDRFRFFADRHDKGNKTVLGETGKMNGEEVLALLCQNEQTAKFITRKLWNWFVYEGADQAVIDRIAKKFYDSKLDIKVLLRTTMESPEFYSEKAVRKVIKNPIDFTVATIRQLGAGQEMVSRIKTAIENDVRNGDNGLNLPLIRSMSPAQATQTSATSMGMEILAPPDVSGWRTGNYWITSATVVERMKWAEKLFGLGARNAPAPGAINNRGNRGPQVGFPAYSILGDCTPEQAVKTLLSVFDAQLPPAKQATLVAAAKTASEGAVNGRNANDVAREVCKLLFASPEFQMA